MANISFRIEGDVLEELDSRVEEDPRFDSRSQLLRYAARSVCEGEYEQSG